MITLTTEIRSKRFREIEKERLYRHLRIPAEDKRDEIEKNFMEFLDNNVIGDVVEPDLLELGGKPYCKKSTSRFSITPGAFSLDTHYRGIPNEGSCKTSLVFEYTSSKYKRAIDSNNYTIDVSDTIIKKCSAEIIEQIKYFLFETAKARFEVTYYGVGTFVKPVCYNYSMYGLFRDIGTWGNLYNKDPKMFEMLYKMYMGKDIKEDTDIITPEKKLLTELKTALGY